MSIYKIIVGKDIDPNNKNTSHIDNPNGLKKRIFQFL